MVRRLFSYSRRDDLTVARIDRECLPDGRELTTGRILVYRDGQLNPVADR